ncbi:putative disease resistance RPP13-like protein 1 [Miscanthus floridulus]|uniref:putative disease resistance RPP13-like protein 1 n=1 Tax=Miscanthus floridulus TaxID=154761 RepID=UPI00345B3927
MEVPNDLVLQARKLIRRLDDIKYYSDHLSLSENDGERRYTPDISSVRHTSSVVFEKSILGRDQDKEKIIDKLLSSEVGNAGNHVSVMAVVGMGGLGKTTLAQLVYNSPRVRQSFEKHAWVCVSENFDIKTMTRNIITSLTSVQCMYTELADLQRKLAKEMNERRVFLVLDDVWNERRDCWEMFCAPMTAAKICQIIVTTRSEVVARLIQTIPFYPLNCLSFDESWLLFSKAACIGEQESDSQTNRINICKSIVKKCKGLPLAIKTLGSMLRYETEETRWEDVLESKLWDLKEPRDEVLPALELSYKHMPTYLRRNFLALSLFPKDYELDSEEVCHLWKLLDLLDSDRSDDECEIGRWYLKELVGRSILQPHPIYGDSYLLHDLVHDLACFFAGEEFHRVEGATLSQIPQNVRYLSINKAITSADISVFPHTLRAIRVFEHCTNISPNAVPEALFSKCKKLRALDISHSMGLGMALHDGVGNLKLLRHLFVQIDRLVGKSTSHHVQNLVLSGIRHLTRLHTLPGIHISRRHCSLNIRDLRNINRVRELSICGLSNIRHVEDATEAQLQRKKHLRSLKLSFNGGEGQCPCRLHEKHVNIPHNQLLDTLRPHHNLRELSIHRYDSGKYPSWLGNTSFSMLSRIAICRGESKHLPKLGALPSLKYLTVNDMKYMTEWSEWPGTDAGGFPCLNTLSISFCPKMISLPLGPFQSLITLNLRWCDSLARLPESPSLHKLEIGYCPALTEIPTLPSLLVLIVKVCSGLRKLPTLPSLLELDIFDCPSLIPIGSDFPSPVVSSVCCFPKLTTLNLEQCRNLCAVGSVPALTTLNLKSGLSDKLMYSPLNDFPSLQCLNIDDSEFTCIPIKQQSLPSVTRLCINKCSNLQYCDGLASLTSLEHLEVGECPKLPIDDLLPPQLKTPTVEDNEHGTISTFPIGNYKIISLHSPADPFNSNSVREQVGSSNSWRYIV